MKTLNHIDSAHGFSAIRIVLWALLILFAISSIFALFEQQKKMQPKRAVKPVDLMKTLSEPSAEEMMVTENEITNTLPSHILRAGKPLTTLSAPLIPPPPLKTGESKVDYHLSAEDATRIQSPRVVNITAGVTVKVTDKAKIGVEASQEVYDFQDAKAWGKDYEDSQEARVKYKVAF